MHASQHSVPCATSGPCRQASMVENAEQHQPQPRLILLVHSNFLRYLLEVMQFQQEPGVLQPSGQSSLGKPSFYTIIAMLAKSCNRAWVLMPLRTLCSITSSPVQSRLVLNTRVLGIDQIAPIGKQLLSAIIAEIMRNAPRPIIGSSFVVMGIAVHILLSWNCFWTLLFLCTCYFGIDVLAHLYLK